MKKNILFIIGDLRTGGAERVVNNLCENLKDKYNITLVLRDATKRDYNPQVNIVEISELVYCKKGLIGIYKLRKLKKELKIDTSISFMLKYNIFNYLSKYHDKVIVSVRNYISANNEIYSKKLLKLYKRIIKRVDLIVNVSEDVMQDQIDNFNSNINKNIVIPNFCDLDYIDKQKVKKIPIKYQKIFNNKTIICPGRYSFQKGQWHLIRAFKKVVEYDNEAHLILVGRGKLKEYYQSLVKDLNLEKNIFILEHMNNIYPYIYNSQIFILNSFYEGMPNVLLEALSCEVPCIATNSPGGSKEILVSKSNDSIDIHLGEYGILIPPCNRVMYSASDELTKEEKIIAEAIILLLKDKNLYNKYKKKSRKRATDYSKEKVLKMWEDII